MNVNRPEARKLLLEYTQSKSLIRHALAVEAAMRAYARNFGEDEDRWGIAGLLHDFDYEQNPEPEDHPRVGAAILEDLGYPEDIIYAIKAHADHMHLPRKSVMDKALFAVDELCGLLTAATLVRPERKVAELPVKSVKKRLKDKAFARNVSREDIRQGAEGLEVDLDEHIALVRDAMAEIAEDLGLAGQEGLRREPGKEAL
jgi:putative nucleotidyltransferase with HDIG domain